MSTQNSPADTLSTLSPAAVESLGQYAHQELRCTIYVGQCEPVAALTELVGAGLLRVEANPRRHTPDFLPTPEGQAVIDHMQGC